MSRQDLQACVRMKEFTLGIQNHIGFMGLRCRGVELCASEPPKYLQEICFKTYVYISTLITFLSNTYANRLHPFPSKPSEVLHSMPGGKAVGAGGFHAELLWTAGETGATGILRGDDG